MQFNRRLFPLLAELAYEATGFLPVLWTYRINQGDPIHIEQLTGEREFDPELHEMSTRLYADPLTALFFAQTGENIHWDEKINGPPPVVEWADSHFGRPYHWGLLIGYRPCTIQERRRCRDQLESELPRESEQWARSLSEMSARFYYGMADGWQLRGHFQPQCGHMDRGPFNPSLLPPGAFDE